MKRSAGVVAVLPTMLLLVCGTACGGGSSAGSGATSDGPDPDRNVIRQGLADVVARAQPGPGDAAEGQCFGNTLMGQTTPQQLQDVGVLDASYRVVEHLPKLPEDLAETWAGAQLRCTDFVERSAQAQEEISHGGLDPEAYADCLRGALSEDELRAAMVDTLTGDWGGADLDRFSAAQGDCAARSPR
ncbi:MAG: hypothetical protein JWN22_1446 [Nocardioides sp.]|nr:hypothetical protein [Nocardioides sp.]